MNGPEDDSVVVDENSPAEVHLDLEPGSYVSTLLSSWQLDALVGAIGRRWKPSW